MKKRYFRVCHKDTLQGLWYDYKGNFTGLIHNDLNFCQNHNLRMDFDEEIVGWLSAVETIEQLFFWFNRQDIENLEKHGWFIHEFETSEYRFYERFNHTIIKQDSSLLIRIHKLIDVKN